MPAAPPLRLRHYDYSTPGAYLVTLCTQHRSPSLGQLVPDGVRLTPLGLIVEAEIQRTTALRADVSVDSAVIMPDHAHVIFVIDGRSRSNISQVVNGLKATTTSGWRRQVGDHRIRVWQRGFHDRIIRSLEMLDRMRRYTAENPARAWLKQQA